MLVLEKSLPKSAIFLFKVVTKPSYVIGRGGFFEIIPVCPDFLEPGVITVPRGFGINVLMSI